jgi:hypothetical protein
MNQNKFTYPIEDHAKTTFDKIKIQSESFEIKISKLLDKINAIHLSDLPGIELEDEFSSEKIPRKLSCIYFLTHDSKGILYIGKTLDLFSRWIYVKSCYPYNPPDKQHHMLERSLHLKNVHLHWFEIGGITATIIEPILINKLKPKWNTVLNKIKTS